MCICASLEFVLLKISVLWTTGASSRKVADVTTAAKIPEDVVGFPSIPDFFVNQGRHHVNHKWLSGNIRSGAFISFVLQLKNANHIISWPIPDELHEICDSSWINLTSCIYLCTHILILIFYIPVLNSNYWISKY